MVQYSQDFDEMTVPYRFGASTTIDCWTAMVYPYIKSLQVFTCPSQSFQSSPLDYAYNQAVGSICQSNGCSGNQSTTKINYPSMTVAIVDAFSEPPGTSDNALANNISAVSGAAYYFAIGNGANGQNSGWPFTDTGGGGVGTNLVSAASVIGKLGGPGGVNNSCAGDPMPIRHSGGANYAFVDGHVKWMKAIVSPLGGSVYAGPTLPCSAAPWNGIGEIPPSSGVVYQTQDNAIGTSAAYE